MCKKQSNENSRTKKNAITEIKNLLNRFNTAKDKIIELEDRDIKIHKLKKREEKNKNRQKRT